MRIARIMGITIFKDSENWFDKFKIRNAISFRKVNDCSNKEYEKLAILCRDNLRFDEIKRSFLNSSIYNFDDTRLEWDSKAKYLMINRIKVKQTSKVNHSITVLLAIRDDGLIYQLC